MINNHVDIRNNPTSNLNLLQIETKFSPIKTSISDLKDLKLLCKRCTIFEKGEALKKMYMLHDERNELYRCPQCNDVTSEKQIIYAMRLELQDYVYYDKTKDIKEVRKQREEEEKFVIQPINADSPSDLLNKVGVRAVKNNPAGHFPSSLTASRTEQE